MNTCRRAGIYAYGAVTGTTGSAAATRHAATMDGAYAGALRERKSHTRLGMPAVNVDAVCEEPHREGRFQYRLSAHRCGAHMGLAAAGAVETCLETIPAYAEGAI